MPTHTIDIERKTRDNRRRYNLSGSGYNFYDNMGTCGAWNYFNDFQREPEITGNTNVVVMLFESEADIRKRELLKVYRKEVELYDDYIKGFKMESETKAQKAISEVSKLNYEAISLELAPNGSLVFRVIVNKLQQVNISLNLNPKTPKEEEGFFTYFVGDDCIYNGMGSFEDVTADVNEILNI